MSKGRHVLPDTLGTRSPSFEDAQEERLTTATWASRGRRAEESPVHPRNAEKWEARTVSDP